MTDESDLEAFWRSHNLSVALASAALSFLRGQISYEGLQELAAHIHREHGVSSYMVSAEGKTDGRRTILAPQPKPKPALRLVSNGD
jgi:hypothetical protein